MLADEVDVVIGVDTHRDAHTLGVVTASTRAVIYQTAVTADAAGYRRALVEVRDTVSGRRAWAVEGSGGCDACWPAASG